MARGKFRYEYGEKYKKFDEIDHTGFNSGEARPALNAVRRISNEYSVTCALVYIMTVAHRNNQKKTSTITHGLLSRETGIGEDTIGSCLDMLSIAGYLTCLQKGGKDAKKGTVRPSVYVINDVEIKSGKLKNPKNLYPDFDKEREKYLDSFKCKIPIDEYMSVRNIDEKKAIIRKLNDEEVELLMNELHNRLKGQKTAVAMYDEIDRLNKDGKYAKYKHLFDDFGQFLPE